jgi:hypothetical protein
LIALPGVASGQRYKVSPAGPSIATPYAAIFQPDGDPADVIKSMNAATESGEMHMGDAIDSSSVSMSACEPHGGLVRDPAS